ncbi:MAG: DUF4350 domain-containing protein [Myxococcales bacterium]|jgi:hypothetical protein
MSRARLLILYAVALALVAGSAIALRSSETRRLQSPIPSIDNPTARGAQALYTYLVETGHAPGVLREPFGQLPADAKIIVSLAPTRRLVTPEEWKSLRAWVEAGGTFVYAVPRRVRTQYIETELKLRWETGPRPAPLLETEALDHGLRKLLERQSEPRDPTGADATPWLPGGPLAGVRSLRVAADDGLETALGPAKALAGVDKTAFVLGLPVGEGEIVVLAGSDLAENRRLALGDNLRLWLNLAARGRLYFDEFHHTEEAPAGRGFLAAFGPAMLQLLLCAGVLALAVGRRLGAPRPLRAARRRSQAEYLEQVAHLYGRASVDGELCGELYRSLRLALFEKLAISASLDDLEVARRLRARAGIPEQRYLQLVRRARTAEQAGATPDELAELSRDFALFERELR